ncbi:MAG TPA: hypothetical protein VE219_00345 [Candidatus Sulfotelmatobacter sp.]|nr:hypothetical protein [Candidatus Sulfotelmatobacter sp.]
MNERLGCALAVVAFLLALTACGDSGTTIDAATLRLPSHSSPGRLASATLYTSPDGGIYRNPDPLEVELMGRVDPAPLEARLDSADDWKPLRPLGQFTVVGMRLRNDGKAGSDPELRQLQIASDFAPDGARGAAHPFYHPLFPVAAASDQPLTSTCVIHLDPGQSALALLFYPPIRPAGVVTWGQYLDFARQIPFGGALPSPAGKLRVSRCARPTTQ